MTISRRQRERTGFLRQGAALAFFSLSSLLLLQPLTAQTPTVIKLWDFHVHDKKFRQSIFKEFNAANPDIKVEYTSQVSGTYQTILDAAFRSGSLPDIFSAQTTGLGIPKAVEMGWIMPLDDVAPSREELQKWMARFPASAQPFLENMNVVKGKVYSWPNGAEGAYDMLYWNTELFANAGLKGSDGGPAVPQEMNDVRVFARKVTELGQGKIYGIVDGVLNTFFLYDIALPSEQLGWSTSAGPLFGFDMKLGSFNYHHAGFRHYIQLWLDMKNDGSVFPGNLSMDDEQAKFKFSQGLAGMIFGGPWVPGGILAVNPDLPFDCVLPPPEKRGEIKGGNPATPPAGSSEYVVSSKTRNKDAAWRVITFMTSQKYQEGWVKAGGGFSIFPEYNKTEFFPHPTLAKIAQLGAVARPTNTPWSKVTTEMGKVFQLTDPGRPLVMDIIVGIYTGQLKWDALDDLEIRSNRAFDKAIEELRKQGSKVSRADFTHPDWDPAAPYASKP